MGGPSCAVSCYCNSLKGAPNTVGRHHRHSEMVYAFNAVFGSWRPRVLSRRQPSKSDHCSGDRSGVRNDPDRSQVATAFAREPARSSRLSPPPGSVPRLGLADPWSVIVGLTVPQAANREPRAPRLDVDLESPHGRLDVFVEEAMHEEVRLQGGQFPGIEAKGVELKRFRLTEVDLGCAQLDRLDLTDGVLDRCTLAESEVSELQPRTCCGRGVAPDRCDSRRATTDRRGLP